MSNIANERFVESAREMFDSASSVAEKERIIELLNMNGFTREAVQLAQELVDEQDKIEDIKIDDHE